MLLKEMKVMKQIVQMERDEEKKGKKLKHKVSFVSEKDFYPYAEKKVKEQGWGDMEQYYYSKEYADEYEMLNKLYEWENQVKSKTNQQLQSLLKGKGLSNGDNVYMDYISESGQHTYKGRIIMIGGKPYVELQNGRSLPWHLGWQKQSSIKKKAPPIYDNNIDNQLYARRLAIEKFLNQSQEKIEKDLMENAPVIFENPTPQWFKDPVGTDIDTLDTKTSAVFGKTDQLKIELRNLPKHPVKVKKKKK